MLLFLEPGLKGCGVALAVGAGFAAFDAHAQVAAAVVAEECSAQFWRESAVLNAVSRRAQVFERATQCADDVVLGSDDWREDAHHRFE